MEDCISTSGNKVHSLIIRSWRNQEETSDLEPGYFSMENITMEFFKMNEYKRNTVK